MKLLFSIKLGPVCANAAGSARPNAIAAIALMARLLTGNKPLALWPIEYRA